MSLQNIKTKKLLTSMALVLAGLVLGLLMYAYSPNHPALAADCKNATGLKGNCITNDINLIVNFLSAGVGVVVVAVVVMGGIQYTTAGDNPEALKHAKERITNGLLALFIFMFIFAFLQWIIPGGIFAK